MVLVHLQERKNKKKKERNEKKNPSYLQLWFLGRPFSQQSQTETNN